MTENLEKICKILETKQSLNQWTLAIVSDMTPAALLGSMDLIVTAGRESLCLFLLTYSPHKISVDARKAIMTTIYTAFCQNKTKQSHVL